MGGIGTAEHVLQFRNAGADLFGIGSSLTGLDSDAMRTFFADLEYSLGAGGAISLGTDSHDTPVSMTYHRCKIIARRHYDQHLYEITLDELPEHPAPGGLSGRYYFLCVPGVGEKPFAVFSAADRSVVIKIVGQLTSHLATLPVGTELLIRGPYGKSVSGIDGCEHCVLVGGGTGIASLLEIAYRLRGERVPMQFVLGVRTASEIFGLEKFEALGPVAIATDDGSLGHPGRVSELLRDLLAGAPDAWVRSLAFINCGPEPMIHACAAVEQHYVSEDRILGAVEYPTSCGVGICGKCSSPSGHLSCIDGPFLPISAFKCKLI